MHHHGIAYLCFGGRTDQLKPPHDDTLATIGPYGRRIIDGVALLSEFQLEPKHDRAPAQAPFELFK